MCMFMCGYHIISCYMFVNCFRCNRYNTALVYVYFQDFIASVVAINTAVVYVASVIIRSF